MPTNEELQEQIKELREQIEQFDIKKFEDFENLLKNHQHDGIDTFNFSKLKRSEKKGLVGGSTTTLHKHDIVEDTTPQLGGDLDLNGHSIDFPSTANISDVKDEDDMASNSATMLATQQSIKKYHDDNAGLKSFSSGVLSKDMSSDTTDNIAHGLGVSPKYVRITMVRGSSITISSVGVYDGNSTACVYTGIDNISNPDEGSSTTYIVVYESAGFQITSNMAVISLSSTNITLTWTKDGTPGGTAYLMWEAFA